MIDFELYRIFVAVAEEENITKASDKLNISQPAITKQIKNLENQLSTKLFERKSKGVSLTEDGKKLYEKLRNPIEALNRIDVQVGKVRCINIGTHNHMGSCVFGNVINEYCLKYPDVNLNLVCEETREMIRKLKNKELDIVFAKKESNIVLDEGIQYIKIGYLHDVIIASKDSEFGEKELTLENIENQVIYVPRTYAQTVYRIKELTKGKNLKLKNSSYKTILKLASSGEALGLITREYVDKDEYKKFNLVEVKTSIKLGKVEFGIYINSTKFKELNDLINLIEKYMIKKEEKE
jgi:DNA-binding transcriptional LysR family regulator